MSSVPPEVRRPEDQPSARHRERDGVDRPAAKPLAGTADLCFVTAVGPDDVMEHLARCGVAVETGPVERIGALGVMLSVYCRDPDGNLIEIATYLGE